MRIVHSDEKSSSVNSFMMRTALSFTVSTDRNTEDKLKTKIRHMLSFFLSHTLRHHFCKHFLHSYGSDNFSIFSSFVDVKGRSRCESSSMSSQLMSYTAFIRRKCSYTHQTTHSPLAYVFDLRLSSFNVMFFWLLICDDRIL